KPQVAAATGDQIGRPYKARFSCMTYLHLLRAQRKIFHFLGNVEFHFNFGFRDKQFHPFVRHSREVLP
ncbi:MAG: hypothetical protein OXN94_06955, partial [Chloroflexota bacterium]|nr:hypothetical protein [Chloroflexota bacterium]